MAANEVAAEWDKAEAAGDTAAMRAMIRRAFPNLVLHPRRAARRSVTAAGLPGTGRAWARCVESANRPCATVAHQSGRMFSPNHQLYLSSTPSGALFIEWL